MEVLDTDMPLKENHSSLGNQMLTNAKPIRAFGREIHNHPKEKFTPPSKKLKHKEVVSPETRERAITKLRLISPSANTIEEYYSSICSYLTIKDASNSLSKDYMSRQSDINWKMRAILVDWLVDVHLKFELLPQTFFGCVNLLDRFLSKTIIERSKLQLVGISCLMIVSKVEEIYSPMVKDYLAVCDNAYSTKDLLWMEASILGDLDFNILCPTSFSFLLNFNAKICLEDKFFCFAHFLLETALLENNHLKHNSVLLVCGAIFFTNKLFKQEGWPEKYEIITGVTEAQLKMAAKDLFVMMQKSEKGELKAVSRKFSDGSFCEVSKYMIQKADEKKK